ncbi:MAG TPA: hypothetical protein VFW00_08910 [Rhodocyclaceae bacterium]|nr:hypothetical protein [Rhodocyclaceae bacterium]
MAFEKFLLPLAGAATIAMATSSASATEPSGLKFVATGGLTYGGDTIVDVHYTNGNHQTLKGGGLVELGGGLQWKASDAPIALQLTGNYHFDSATARNGQAYFERWPIEGMAYYQPDGRWHAGLGVRYAIAPKARMQIDGGSDQTVEFKNAFGGIAEVGYRFGNSIWVNARYVGEDYTPKSATSNTSTYTINTNKASGAHFGVNVVFGF